MIEPALQIFQETTFFHCIRAMVDRKVVILSETTNHEAAKEVKTAVHHTRYKVVRRDVTEGTVNEVI